MNLDEENRDTSEVTSLLKDTPSTTCKYHSLSWSMRERIEYPEEKATYARLIGTNRPYRLSLLSYLISHAGE